MKLIENWQQAWKLKSVQVGAASAFFYALICSVYFKNCSSTAHYSYAYNLGKAVVWPVTIFKN